MGPMSANVTLSTPTSTGSTVGFVETMSYFTPGVVVMVSTTFSFHSTQLLGFETVMIHLKASPSLTLVGSARLIMPMGRGTLMPTSGASRVTWPSSGTASASAGRAAPSSAAASPLAAAGPHTPVARAWSVKCPLADRLETFTRIVKSFAAPGSSEPMSSKTTLAESAESAFGSVESTSYFTPSVAVISSITLTWASLQSLGFEILRRQSNLSPGLTLGGSARSTMPMPGQWIPSAGTARPTSMCPRRMSARWLSPWSRSRTRTTSAAPSTIVPVWVGLEAAAPSTARGASPMAISATPGMLTLRPLSPRNCWRVSWVMTLP